MSAVVLLDYQLASLSIKGAQSFLDLGSFSRELYLASGSKLHYVLIVRPGEQKLSFYLSSESVLHLSVVVVGDTSKVSADIRVVLDGASTYTNFYCANLLLPDADVYLSTAIGIKEHSVGAQGYLLEENILLGTPKRFVTIPALDVYCDDVRASHGAKTHKLNSEKLFYMQSKGISHSSAEKMFVTAYVDKAFAVLGDDVTVIREKNKIIGSIL